MPHTARSDVPVPRPVTVPTIGSRRWIDLVLVAGGAVLTLGTLPLLGLPLLLTGLLLPLLEFQARRAGGIDHLLRLVPPEVADAHRAVVRAAGRPGVVEPDDVIAGADELVLEVAAMLGGRAARRASQRRFVAARIAALRSVAAELTDRHDAWQAAMDELEALAPVDQGELIAERAAGPGWLSTMLLVLLAPGFLLVDLVRGAGRSIVALVEGLALRLRTIVELAMAVLRAVGRVVADALASWRALVAAMGEAARTARGRFVAGRALALRRLRRAPRGLGGRPL